MAKNYPYICHKLFCNSTLQDKKAGNEIPLTSRMNAADTCLTLYTVAVRHISTPTANSLQTNSTMSTRYSTAHGDCHQLKYAAPLLFTTVLFH